MWAKNRTNSIYLYIPFWFLILQNLKKAAKHWSPKNINQIRSESMASKAVSCMLLSINAVLYFIVIVASSWAVNHGIIESRQTGMFFFFPDVYVFSQQIHTRKWHCFCWFLHNIIIFWIAAASVLPIPARIFPIYFPFGNLATGFLIIYSLIAGIVGFITSLNGLHNLAQWDSSSQHAAAASSLISWLLTLLAMG